MTAPATTSRAPTDLSARGYALITPFQAAKDLKKCFSMLQVKVYDAERKRIEQIELAPT